MSKSSAPSKRRHPVFGASRVPRYLQLADIFRQRIARGVWKPGQMLPSIEMLMGEFAVARVTVRQAIKLLSDEELVSPQRGKGTVVHEFASAKRQLRVHTTLGGLVDMYRGDKPVLTNLEESNTSPELLDSDGVAAPSYFHMRRVHARDNVKYCVISIYIDERIFRKARSKFRNEAVLPVLFSLPGIKIGKARQTMHISKADVEVASLLEIPLGEPMADVRRILSAPDNTVIYLADVAYRGDYIHLDIDLQP
ncbi:MAG: GntR family transcriptional regulator [Gammaproteobacteria bacterium]|nr:GntR family transcriptional regulator [Gammaproteobacteria bacterium]MDH3465933.1 GntR family transcriptional regulator [Gammaproteobacteria bacterium]